MKKLTIAIAIIIIISCITKQEELIIPKEAIRFRVVANSNSPKDQEVKRHVVNNLNKNITKLQLIPRDINASRQSIKNSIPLFKQEVEKSLNQLNASSVYTIYYGMNYFPKKEYKGIKYEEGEYESLVITLGDGLGENFWCILFPPLCLLEGEETEKDKVEYTSFIQEIINKYF